MMMSITKVEVVMMIMELSNQCLGNLLTAAIRDTLATRTITPSLQQQQQQQRKFSEMITILTDNQGFNLEKQYFWIKKHFVIR